MSRRPTLVRSVPVEAMYRGSWNRLSLQGTGLDGATILHVRLYDAGGEPLRGDLHLHGPVPGPGPGEFRHALIAFVPAGTAEIRLFARGPAAAAVRAPLLGLRRLGRLSAGAALLRQAPSEVLRGLPRKALRRPGSLPGLLRALLAAEARKPHVLPHDYGTWVGLFDVWDGVLWGAGGVSVGYLVLVGAGGPEGEAGGQAGGVSGAWSGSGALSATLSSLGAQRGGAVPWAVVGAVVGAGASLRAAAAGLGTDYVGLLAPGEVLAPHATVLAADQLARLGRPELATADWDALDAAGRRHAPVFNPRPNHALMLSGMLSQGLWLVRRDTALGHLPEAPPGAPPGTPPGTPSGAPGPPVTAEEARLALWLSRRRAGAEEGPARFGQRIPYILVHRRADTQAAPPAALAALVAEDLAAASQSGAGQAGASQAGAGQAGGGPAIEPVTPAPAALPLTFRLRPGPADARVTAIVPSTLRQPHALACLRAVLAGTGHDALDLHVVVMQPGPLDARQQAAAETLARDPRASVTWLEAPAFNFSAANNHVAARTAGEHVLLLNDDVSPIRPDWRPDWLRWMAAFLADPRTGLVGARLLYPDGSVQHGGVIMGLAGLCDHAHRHLPGHQPGYRHRAVLAQELSAVTAACMLVRRSLYEAVGGLDETYPSAFNDVDFALRIGEAGHAVVLAPQAELHHHELQTYGSHYAGNRQPFHATEVLRMRTRWNSVCQNDPFHNPNLGLNNGFEWEPAFPPRVGGGEVFP